MFVVFLLAVAPLSPELRDLASRARAMSKHHRTLTSGPSFADPGQYRLGSITFTLSQRVTGDVSPNVAGYALGRSVLAVIAPDLDDYTIFIESSTQTLFEIRGVLDTDADVTFYQIRKKNPLSVFTNLRFRTPSSAIGTNYNCTMTGSFYTAGYCTASASVNVDPTTGAPIPIHAPPLNGQEWGDLLAGGLVSANGAYEVAINGLTDLELDYSLDVSGVATTGFVLNGEIGIGSTNLPALPIPLYGESRTFLGFEIGISLDAVAGVNLKNLTVNISKPINFDRRLGFSARLTGSISTSKGLVTNPLEYDITPVPDENLNPASVFAFFDGLKLTATTLVDVGVRFVINVGSLTNLTAEVGATLSSFWDFGADVNSCPCPYLYGKVSSKILTHASCPGLTIFGFQLIKPFGKEALVVPDWFSSPYCLFTPEKAEEGMSSLRLVASDNSWVVEVPRFRFTPSLGLLFAKCDIRVRLDALAGGVVFRDLHFPPFDWDVVFTEQVRESGKRMVLVAPPVGTAVRGHSTQDIFWWTRETTSSLIALDGEGNHEIDLGYEMGSADVVIATATNVEPTREFPGTGGRYLSFQPTYAAGTVLGVITHSVTGGEAYSAPVLARVFDDTQETEYFSSRYTARNDLAIDLTSFRSTAHPNATIRFISKLNTTEVEIGYGAGVGIATAQNLPGSRFGFISPIVIDLTKRPDLIVVCALANGEKNQVTQQFEFPYSELDQTGNFTLAKTATAASISLSASRSQPNVVFELPAPLTSAHRGIVCKVADGVNGKATATLTGIEKYGIARFSAVSIPTGDYVGILISMPGLVPLCAHNELDGSHFFIVLAEGETKFDSDIHIPFRRKDDGDKTYEISLTSVFSTTKDGICQQGASVKADAGSDVGCFESVVNGKTFVQNWTVIGGSSNLLAYAPIARATTETSDDGKWHLRLFRAVADAVLTFVPALLAFPERAISLTIDADLVATFRLQSDVGITINCSFATRLKIVDVDGEETILERGVDGFFTFHPGKLGDLLAVALCDTPERPYCEFQQGFGTEGYTLVQYGGEDGVRELGEGVGDTVGSLLRGVTRQLVKARDNISLYKTWEGALKAAASFTKEAALEFVIDKSKAALRTISAKFGSIDVPFSAENFYKDPEAVLEALGVIIPETGLTADVATFTRDGRVVVGERFFDPELIQSGNVSVAVTLGLPADMVSSQSYSEIEPTEEKSQTLAIVLGVVGALLVIAIVIVVVLVLRRKKDEGPKGDGFLNA